MSIRFTPEVPEPETRWFYTPGTKVLFIQQPDEVPLSLQVRFA